MLNKIRGILTLTTIVVVVVFASIFGRYAKGYKFDLENFKFIPNGLLVVKSQPNAAEVFVNGTLETAADATIKLPPGVYDVSVQKDGFIPWNKRLTVEKEVVTAIDVELFRNALSLSAITFSGVISPTSSDDHTKIAFAVPPTLENGQEKSGLWVMEMSNLPLGFSRDPRRITDGNLVTADWQWSPNGREILLTTSSGIFLLDTSQFTPQSQRVNIASKKSQILTEWGEERKKKLSAKVRPLPEELHDIFLNRVSSIEFSPNEDNIMYTANSSATIPEELIKPIPGASTQKEERDIKPGSIYIYDIKEDRNFLIDSNTKGKTISWFATSNHVLIAEKSSVFISDKDGTNKQSVYSGSYSAPFAFPTLKSDRILILTDLGSNADYPNLYSLGVK